MNAGPSLPERATAGDAPPRTIQNTAQLEDLLSHPPAVAVDAVGQLPGSIVVLGAGGKMGPSLVRMIVRARQQLGHAPQVTAVSRFHRVGLEDQLHALGATTCRGDLLDPAFVESLPPADHIIFMAGVKFGTSQQAAATWAMNTFVPALVAQRYRSSRMLVFSTGNVYPLVAADSSGSLETDSCQPVGEYGMSALGRERMWEYFSTRFRLPITIVRLNYAVEMRYGVLVDLAQRIAGHQPIDLTMGFANAIWQGDANAMALAAWADAASPPWVVNVAGPRFSVRDVAQALGRLMGNEVQLTGTEAATALLSNAALAYSRYGPPRVALKTLITWTADWIARGGETWNKPTHFQVRDGQF